MRILDWLPAALLLADDKSWPSTTGLAVAAAGLGLVLAVWAARSRRPPPAA